MPDYYDSIGAAVAAAMDHDTKLAHRAQPSNPPRGPSEQQFAGLHPDINRAYHLHVDIAIFDGEGQSVWADTRADVDSYAHRLLEAFGFVRARIPEGTSNYYLQATLPRTVQQAHAATTARVLAAADFTVALDAALSTDSDMPSAVAEHQNIRARAATHTSPTAGKHSPSPARDATTPPPTAPTTPTRRTR